MYTYWDEDLGSYLLTEEGKKLTERDMINIIGITEHGENHEDISKVFALGALFGSVAISDKTLSLIEIEKELKNMEENKND